MPLKKKLIIEIFKYRLFNRYQRLNRYKNRYLPVHLWSSESTVLQPISNPAVLTRQAIRPELQGV
ncbi:MAG: hypothetical protein EA360_03780 [Balneolaceae bacterium]|nr:MAG: hypothetical protein EA360_03780 [Balneolaceae bacterium]